MEDVEKVNLPPEPEPETPPPPQVEAVDADGVPYKNRAEEYRRKYEAEQNLNQRYQQELGRFTQQRQPAPQPESVEAKFDAESQKFVDERVERTAHRIILREHLKQEIAQDPELQRAANEEYGMINQNPFYMSLPQEVKESLAISNAKAKVLASRLESAKKGTIAQAHAQASQAQAAAASIPSTSGNPPASQGNKDQYMREFINDPEQRSYCKKMWKLDPDSAEGQAKMKQVAEYAWRGSPVSERFAQQVEMVRKGGQ